MILLPAEARAPLPRLYATEGTPADEKLVVCKLFCPWGRATWLVVEGEQREFDFIMFAFVVSPLGADCDEWGYVSPQELEAIRGPGGLRIEMDRHFEPTKFAELRRRAS